MNEQTLLSSILTNDFSLVTRAKRKGKCSIKSCLSIFKPQAEKNKSYYITEWRKYLSKEARSKDVLNDPFKILTNLWAHKDVTSDLEGVRINPNLINNCNFIRNDLEFYIPQLCSFMLFGEFEVVEKFLSVLCKACYSSFSFSHRTLWFLKSMIYPMNPYNRKIRDIMHLIQTIFKSESNEIGLTRLNVAGSDEYIKYLNKAGNINNVNNDSVITINKTNSIYQPNDQMRIEIFKRYSYETSNEEEINLQTIKQIDLNDINLTSFLSNVNFYDHLCNICDELRFIDSHEERMKQLRRELNKVNDLLPCNVYVPFNSGAIRNYVIANIPLNEVKIFKTKERTPIKMTMECFRLDEIHYNEDKEEKEVIENEKGKVLTGPGKKLNKMEYLMENDILLSKPLAIKSNSKNIPSEVIDNVVKASSSINLSGGDDSKDKKEISLDDSINNSMKRVSMRKSSMSSVSSIESEGEQPHSLSPIENNNDESMISSGTAGDSEVINSKIYDDIFGESSLTQSIRLKINSIYGKLNTYKTFSIIIKSGEDLRQEQFASQLINEFNQIFQLEHVGCYLYPYEIVSTGVGAGIIEVVPDSMSLDELKHHLNPSHSLKHFYEFYFKKSTHPHIYKCAIKNLIKSLAGYSLVCYFLQIKDRHNGNILIDSQGHLIHIDFGFIFSHAPGNEFETAPFKLTNELLEIFGGVKSKNFQKFRKLLWKGIIAISKHYEKILILTQMMFCGYGNSLECFEGGQEVIEELRGRFQPKENMKARDYLELIDKLVEQALFSWRTKWYDKYQYYFQGIFY